MQCDFRNIANGLKIPGEVYCDQPYIVKTDDGAWLCCMTTGPGHEGNAGQHVITMRSYDHGKTWSKPISVEPSDGPEASYAVMLKAPNGRIYIFYNHNTDNVREVKRHDGLGAFKRVDSLGYFVFKYSDDHGKSWSKQRYPIPVRLFECDRQNVYGGDICFFWNVGKPFIHNNAVFVSLHKVGKMGAGFFAQSEGCFLKSDNLLIESDLQKIRWETLPDGDIGLRSPAGGGTISEEQSCVVLSDGSLYVVYRSIDGYPVEAYSCDEGHTWSEPCYMRYADGHLIKNPRAANFIWKCQNGKYLYWFHNHGGHFIRDMWGIESDTTGLVKNCIGSPYDDRNPVWLCGGIEDDSPEGKIIKWSQPEIVLYDNDPIVRISYPDFIEDDNKYYFTETQKTIGRVHEIPSCFLNQIWESLEKQMICATSKNEALLVSTSFPSEITAPTLPAFFERDADGLSSGGKTTGNGFAMEFDVQLVELADVSILEGRQQDGRGLELNITETGCLELIMNDGWTEHKLVCEPCLDAKQQHHVVINVDGGPHIVSFIIDGHLCDGGEYKQFGWQRFSPQFRHLNWAATWRINNSDKIKVNSLRAYNRVLLTAEAGIKR